MMQRKTRSMIGWGFGRTNTSPAHHFCTLVPQSIQAVANALLSLKEDPSVWDSPELRESMEKVQARILVKRGS